MPFVHGDWATLVSAERVRAGGGGRGKERGGMNVGEHGGLRRDHGCGVTAGVESLVTLRSCTLNSGFDAN